MTDTTHPSPVAPKVGTWILAGIARSDRPDDFLHIGATRAFPTKETAVQYSAARFPGYIPFIARLEHP